MSDAFLPPLGWVLRTVLYTIGLFKAIEILLFNLWLLRHGSTYGRTLIGAIKPGTERKYKSDVVRRVNIMCSHPVPIFNRWYDRLSIKHTKPHLPHKALQGFLRFISVYIFRQPMIVVLFASFLLLYPHKILSLVDSILLIAIIFLELGDLLIARCVLGYADNFRLDFTYYSHAAFSSEQSSANKTFRISTDHFLSKFMVGIGIFLSTTWFAFASIFYNIEVLSASSGSSAFDGFIQNALLFPQCLYFSLVTITTAGYGDISPVSILTQFYVSAEVLIGLSTIIFLFFALATTFSSDST